MENNLTPLSLDETFTFTCSSKVDCYNECCKNLNQFLTPYDILRLKNHLRLTSTSFLEQFTFQQIGPETGLPIISLKPDTASELKCPFVSQSGCTVYQARPSSCRTYPLVRILSRTRDTGNIKEQYFLLKESHCHGFKDGQKWTVNEWITNQGITPYNETNDLLMEIISLKNRLIPGQLDIKSKHLFHMVCYDLDGFRKHILENDLLKDFGNAGDINNVSEKDDTHLLKIGLTWLKHVLFYEK